MDITEEKEDDNAQSPSKTQDDIDRLISNMRGAIDVLRDVDHSKTKDSDHIQESDNKNIPNISIFDNSSDFPIEPPASRLDKNETPDKSRDLDMTSSVKESESGKGQEDRPVPPTTGQDDFLEYRADDSDRVYAMRNYADTNEHRDPEKLFEGTAVQQNLSDKGDTEDSSEDVTVESVISSSTEQSSAQEVG